MAAGGVTYFWALDKNRKPIHIRDAKSGANGYFCEGCRSEMEACIGEGIRQPYFRHHSKEGEAAKNCTWSSESARHSAAKRILQILKQVKVPNVYLEVPAEFGGGLSRIRKSDIVSAHSVLVEKYVYQDEYGNVKMAAGSNTEISQKFNAVKPDLIFLDKENRPILLIELCATHKVNLDKRAKLFSLGINAIEIKIPKAHDNVEIERNFHITQNTHWLYNHEQATTKFSPHTHLTARESKKSVVDRGEFFPEETFECRTFAIKETIRIIERLLGDAEFNARKGDFEAEIARIERNKEGFRARLAERNSGAEAEARNILAELEGREQQKIDKLIFEEAELSAAERNERGNHKQLEERYNTADARLRGEEAELAFAEREYRNAMFDFYTNLEREERELDAGFQTEEDATRASYEGRRANLTSAIQQLEREIRYFENRAERGRRLENERAAAQSALESEIADLERERRSYEPVKERRKHFEGLRKQLSYTLDQALQSRAGKGE